MRYAWIAATLLGAFACSSSPPDPAGAVDAAAPATEAPPPALVITRLTIVDETPPELRPVQLSAALLEAPWKAALQAAGFTFAEGAPDGVAVRLDAQVAYGLTKGEGLLAAIEPARAEVRWAVKARLRPPGAAVSDHAWFEGTAGAAFEGDAVALEAALRTHIAAAIDQPARELKARATLMALPPARLIDRLKSAEPSVRLAAVDRLGALRATEAVEPLIALTKEMKGGAGEADRTLTLRVIGALAEIGDDSAAKALISLANPRDREMLRAVVEALSVVGGERVSDFLDVLSAHDAADVREMVEAARARLARKAKRE